MDDNDIELCNACTDLVSLKKTEAFPLRLFGASPVGSWVGVGDLCRQLGLPVESLTPDLFAAWLPDPAGDDAYAVIVFHDNDSGWCMTARYNRARLGNDAAGSLKSTAATSVATKSAISTQPASRVSEH